MRTRVHVVGCGLIGTSIGMALSRKGFQVTLSDASPTAVALARDLGAGMPASAADAAPDVVVVAAPPDVAASVVVDQLTAYPSAVVTDVASMKAKVLDDVAEAGADLTRYVGSHPMAGRERSGAVAARADLFEGRTWVVCPGPASSPRAAAEVEQIARATGAATVTMGAEEHDEAVAAVSHLPQVAASLVAARLRDLPDDALALCGQGVRDVTRIAESDPMLWTQILAGNAAAVAPVLDRMAADLDAVRQAVSALGAESRADGARGVVAKAIADGQLGHARIPGKHGSAPTAYATVIAVVPDRAGALARLFQDVGDAGINLEDLRLEHGVGAQVGLAELSVLPAVAERLREVLSHKGWSVHE
ncbi:prephenate dehydrogenase [Calidifontibacter sp. DB0510]|uniref:Prephenate dehydrogenase n=1 Tax=Metallococcus carri TaxID=1656884 RepID=A0A967B2B6_9MICO|nr:prephenate dehydrogenase [Metallococcus carri]NHN57008.1 prephenate dehydrogenase [Metallococcus carri]NOP37753.1 prephenate dehydrogenase [Calidifontibacter sp. DB2511S]